MSKLSSLGLSNEAVGQEMDYGDLPTFGGMRPLHPTGPYRFKLPPPAALDEAFEKVTHWNADLPTRERIEVRFEGAAALTIVQGPVADLAGKTFETRVNNMERGRGKKDSGIVASNFDYLLRGLGVKTRPKTNLGQAQALVKCGTFEFGADNVYSYRCSKTRDAYFAYRDAAGAESWAPAYAEGVSDENVAQVAETERFVKGCGKSFYPDRDVKKEGGEYPEHITCTCGARIRAFEELDNFRS